LKRPFNSSGTLLLRLACRSVATWLVFTAVVASGKNVRFAVIGDYGIHNEEERRVAAMVQAWRPDFILTVGDNAYDEHTSQQDAFQWDVGTYYSNYIVRSSWDPYARRTRFFPSLGNHDYNYSGPGVDPVRLAAYERAFAVPPGPGGHHYYEFARGPVRFFALDSNKDEYPNWGPSLAQGRWLETAIRRARERWKIVFFHHSPYHSGSTHWNETHMRRFNFERLGVTAVLAGHEHVYERVMRGGVPFITNGLGGYGIYEFREQLISGSAVHYPAVYPKSSADMRNTFGALFVEASFWAITVEFWNLRGEKIDDWYWPPLSNPSLSRTPAAQP
jgi:tartrate-resistant acid phosphatase type 5